jgi:hypothetical protein
MIDLSLTRDIDNKTRLVLNKKDLIYWKITCINPSAGYKLLVHQLKATFTVKFNDDDSIMYNALVKQNDEKTSNIAYTGTLEATIAF